MLKQVQHDVITTKATHALSPIVWKEKTVRYMCKEKTQKMGLSSNQARFLSLTSRQIDLEHRIQQICQRRLRLTSELENVATTYNNKISNRKMFTPSTAGIQSLSVDGLKKLGYRVINAATKTAANAPIKAVNQLSESQIKASYDEAHIIRSAADLQTKVNADLSGSFVLAGDVDMSTIGVQSSSVIGNFAGTFDGNGYVINNLNISSSAGSMVGLFSRLSGGTIKNVGLENVNISNNSGQYTGALVGYSGGTGSLVDNCYATGVVSSLGGSWTGGIVGSNEAGATLSNSWSDVNVTATNGAGGIAGANANGDVTIKNCYSLGDVTATTMYAGGIVGVNKNGNAVVENCYTNSNVSSPSLVGGVVGVNYDEVNVAPGLNRVINSYSANCTVSGSTNAGVVGMQGINASQSGCFYVNNGQTGDPGGGSNTVNTTGWDTNIWDLSTPLPTFVSKGTPSNLEEGLRNGKYSLAREADEFSQDTFDIGGEEYQEIDWRSTPEIFDELYKGDDVEAENKYDKTIDEINSQDKKLQLEQTTIEVEYKAISSERESVKKILDTNAQSSFKYFS